MINWYAVQAKSHNEARVLQHLTQKVIPAFLPLIEVIHRYRSRRIARLQPLFPGYLFVQMERNPDLWNTVRWTPGVKSILGTEGAPVPVPLWAIAAIKTRVQDLGFVRSELRFGQHDRVRIQRGPLAGLEAVFDRPLSNSGRMRVLLRLLGQERGVQVDVADLELA